ncbi:SCP2 sterol-binding domain-containing protein [Aliiglaciecola sp. CAU 1673]|uniref:ubiquinone anaerobic biosynthesis accessory factor UbiT n=1 Tax=Aliiglaciecola sp. CAU 1673 TaxID=3032595 RepID=UPI0023DA70DA|nr:SCP2 sterol-binding domain-containing protein [Aliiglaciecola sp. CAU 1673]MDF2177418.1 SCP2 sterol-binding domain-containing protein [Aliiglaciecola sp. CAU 1673]
MKNLICTIAESLFKPGIVLFSKLPPLLQCSLAEGLLNQALKQPLAEGELDFIGCAVLKIRVDDLHQAWYLRLHQGRLRVALQGQDNACFSGESQSFLLLASQSVDPDTLFFQRKLMISGDTELALAVKNLLDSLELEQFPPLFSKPLSWFGQCKQAQL